MRATSNLARLDASKTRLSVHVHDGTLEGMRTILARANPDLVFHVASRFVSQHQPGDVEPLIESNVMFAVQIAEAMSLHGVRNLINIGTSWQNYEDKDYSPVCLYAATKQATEALLQFYTETGRLRVITLRLFDTYGPGDTRPKLLNLLRRIADSGESLDMSPGGQLQDMVYIDDVLDAFELAANRLRSGDAAPSEVFAVSSGHPVPLKEVVSSFAAAYGKPVAIRWGGRPYREREVMVPWSRGVPVPGWQPKVSLADGLKRIVRDQHV